MIYEQTLDFLIRNDYGDPRWAPAAYFEAFTDEMPAGWKFALGDGIHLDGRKLWEKPVVARWGYPELVDDPMHFNAIVDGDPAALEIFNKHFSAAEQQAGEGLGTE